MLAAAGMTKAKTGTELFTSPHTVEWHLRKVYTKFGVNSRRALPGALAARMAVKHRSAVVASILAVYTCISNTDSRRSDG